MKFFNRAASYILAALAGIGMIHVTDSIIYEHPSLLLSSYYRDDLKPDL